MAEDQNLFALLIDGDNVQVSFIPQILHSLSEYGVLRISKVFHNKATIEQWEQIAREYGIEPIWVPNNTAHKNTVDIALVMDAMSVLYERVDISHFCIVASDGDYTRLARHLKTQGKFVLGIGTKQTPKPFTNACSTFVYVEDLPSAASPVEQAPTPVEVAPALAKTAPVKEISDSKLAKLVIRAYKQASKTGVVKGGAGWVQLRDIRDAMAALNPDFQASDYYKYLRVLAEKMMTLAESHPASIEVYEQADGKPLMHYVRVFDDQELVKFIRAYKRAADELNLKDKNGWVSLSAIGSSLKALYPKDEPLVYHKTKYAQLKKVVEQMVVDYPTAFELNPANPSPRIRIKK